jgi:hypothetical protein
MPLDFCHIDSNGKIVGQSVAISAKMHRQIIENAVRNRLTSVLRMDEFYNDFIYDHGELPNLIRELKQIAENINDRDVKRIVQKMIDVATEGDLRFERIEIIAD